MGSRTKFKNPIDNPRTEFYLVCMATRNKKTVPHGTPNPIDFLVATGVRIIDLTNEWDLNGPDTVYRLRRFSHVPSNATAAKMAATFGWTLGDVINLWSDKVRERAR